MQKLRSAKTMTIPFIRLKDGNNILRIVTDAKLYNFVRYKGKNDKGYGHRVVTG